MKKEKDEKEEEWNDQLLPTYKYIKHLGEGSYGSVCLALHVETNEQVAIKKLSKIFNNSLMWKRVMREVEILCKLDSWYVVSIIGILMNENKGDLYLVLEYAKNDLSKLYRSSIYLVKMQIKVIMYRLLLGLNYMHSAMIVHRDIKPANILINQDCSIKICDFSLSRSIHGLKTAAFDYGNWLRGQRSNNVTLDNFSSMCSYYTEGLESSKIISGSGDLEEADIEDFDEGEKCIEHRALGSEEETKFDMGKSKGKTVQYAEEEHKPIMLPAAEDNQLKVRANQKAKRMEFMEECKKDDLARELTGHVTTRWYRPPEVILVEKAYTTAMDIWSLGCVFAELFFMLKENEVEAKQRQPLFKGDSSYPLSPSEKEKQMLGAPFTSKDQLILILELLGTPKENDLSFISDIKAIEYVKSFPPTSKKHFQDIFPACGREELDLLTRMLQFNPYNRISTKECLRHKYFEGVRKKELEIEMKPITLAVDDMHEGDMKDLTTQIINQIRKQC